MRARLSAALFLAACLALPACQARFVENKIYASDASEDDLFGWMVDMWGHYAIVGAQERTPGGRAYIFHRDTTGNWTQVEALGPPNTNGFGQAVAIGLYRAAVGTHVSEAHPQGAVFIYRRDGSSWSSLQTLLPPDDHAGQFGASVELSGAWLIVGDPADTSVAPGGGRAHVYRPHPGGMGFVLETSLSADVEIGDLFGVSVGVSGNSAIVGAERDGEAHDGAAYLFEYTGFPQGSWNLVQKLKPASGSADDFFGHSVSIAAPGGLAVVGALGDDQASWNAGAAYVYQELAGNWQQLAKLTASNAMSEANFGKSVATGFDRLVVGAPKQAGNAFESGAAFHYEHTGSNAFVETPVMASDGGPQDNFGRRVSLYGADLIVGAGTDDDRGHDAGAAYLYEPEPSDAIEVNIVLAPWPYLYIYTGCEDIWAGTPARFRLVAGEGLALSYELSVPPEHGRVELDAAGGQVVYVPEDGFVGYDEFRVGVRDREGHDNEVALQVLVKGR